MSYASCYICYEEIDLNVTFLHEADGKEYLCECGIKQIIEYDEDCNCYGGYVRTLPYNKLYRERLRMFADDEYIVNLQAGKKMYYAQLKYKLAAFFEDIIVIEEKNNKEAKIIYEQLQLLKKVQKMVNKDYYLSVQEVKLIKEVKNCSGLIKKIKQGELDLVNHLLYGDK